MSDRGNDSQPNCLGSQQATGAGTPDPSTATGTGVPSNTLRPPGRAAGEPESNRVGEFSDEPLVLEDAPPCIALPAPLAHLAVGEALALGLGDGLDLGEDSLPLVALAGSAPLHDHR